VPIIRRNICIYATNGTCYSVWMTVWYAGWNFIPLCIPDLTSIPSSHLHRLLIPDDVLIQFDLLMMSIVMFETCRDIK